MDIICLHCGETTPAQGRFCRACGKNIKSKKVITHSIASWINFGIIKRCFKKLSIKATIIIVIVATLTATSVYAAPKAKDFITVRKAIDLTHDKSAAGDYKSALNSIREVRDIWSTNSQKQEMETLISTWEKYIKYQESFANAIKKEGSGSLTEARDLLNSIGIDYPEYEEVRIKLAEIQSKIEGNLQSKANAAAAAKVEAERKAQVAAEARAQAQAEAQAATTAKAQADANAAASAQAARNAEIQRQQAAAQRVEEIKKSFKNELTAGYNSYIQSKSYYSSAIQYSNAGNSLMALSQAASTRAVLNTARSTVSDLNQRFTGLSSDYYTAANNMLNAIDNKIKALNLLVESEGTYLDYSSMINSYSASATQYANNVKTFLGNNSY